MSIKKLIVLLAFTIPTSGVAQVASQVAARLADSSAADVVRHLRSVGPAAAADGWMVDLMRQRIKAQSREKLDALADSLTAAAVDGSRGAPVRASSIDPIAAFTALSMAGRIGSYQGTPYAGAVGRMIRIHRDGSGSLRTLALGSMLSVAGPRNEALEYLRSVAVSQDRTAQYAVTALIDEAQRGSDSNNSVALRNEAREVLRQLFERGLVKDEFALLPLQIYGFQQGWKPPDYPKYRAR